MPDDILEMIGTAALLEQLAEESAELAQAALHMAVDKRSILQALEISATGAKLFNDIVCWIFAEQEGRDLPHRNGWELASALENWYAAYLTEWRAVSKESTLRRTQQLITSYADTLRG